jgi:hypothetical protein
LREINKERENEREMEREEVSEIEGGGRERKLIVWSCWVIILGILGERDRGKEGGRERENKLAKGRESEGEREIGER